MTVGIEGSNRGTVAAVEDEGTINWAFHRSVLSTVEASHLFDSDPVSKVGIQMVLILNPILELRRSTDGLSRVEIRSTMQQSGFSWLLK